MEKNFLKLDDTDYETTLTKKFKNRKKYIPLDYSLIKAFIPGTIRDIFVKTGDYVNKGDKLLVLEAMKMKNIITSPAKGKVKNIKVKENQSVPKNELLIELEI